MSRVCKKCGIPINWENKKREYCSFKCSNHHLKKENDKFCLKCGKKLNFTGRQRRNNYCSFKCSNSNRDHQSIGKKGWITKKANGLSWKWKVKGIKWKRKLTEEEINQRRERGKIGGINSAKNQPERSKGEIFLSNLLKKNGYRVSDSRWDIVNGYEIDIFLTDLNIAISYNGPVHRIPIYGQKRLDQVIRRDYYRNRKLNEMGIKHIIIEDNGPFSEEKVNTQFELCLKSIKEKPDPSH